MLAGEDGEVRAVDDVSFALRRGTTTAIVGESGSGKSTVAQMVLKLLEPTSGRVLFEGEDVADLRGGQLKALRRRVQPIFQNPYGTLDPMYSIYRAIAERRDMRRFVAGATIEPEVLARMKQPAG